MFIYFKSHLFLSASAGLPKTLQHCYMVFWTAFSNSQPLSLDILLIYFTFFIFSSPVHSCCMICLEYISSLHSFGND